MSLIELMNRSMNSSNKYLRTRLLVYLTRIRKYST